MYRPARLSSHNSIEPVRALPRVSSIRYLSLRRHFLAVVFLSQRVWRRDGVLELDAARHALAHLRYCWSWCGEYSMSSQYRTRVGIERMCGRCRLRSCWRFKESLAFRRGVGDCTSREGRLSSWGLVILKRTELSGSYEIESQQLVSCLEK
jgi:hypothetical protein